MQKTVIFSILFLLSLQVFSQTNGTVVDEKGNPLEEVVVFVYDYNIISKTNASGSFIVNEELPKSTLIHFSKNGYSSKLVKYNNNLKISLKKLHIELDEVGVVENATSLGNSKLVNIETKKLSKISSNSMVEDISELSGVDMISSGLGIQKLVVRGLSGMRVVTYLNGMQINNQQWANDHGIGFTDLGLGEVELIKGASSLKYGGEALGGLLFFKDYPFITSESPEGFVSTKFNNSGYYSSSKFGVKLKKNKFYLNVYGQYSLSSDFRLPDDNYLINSRFQQQAVKFSLGYRHKNWQNIFRYHLHKETTGIPGHVHGNPVLASPSKVFSESIDKYGLYTTLRPNQFVDNQLFIYESNYIIDNFKFDLYAGHFINNLQEWEKQTRPGFDLELTQTLVSPNIRYSNKNITINSGVQIKFEENKNKLSSGRLVPDASSSNIGPYLILDVDNERFGFSSGIRLDLKNLKVDDQSEDFSINYSNKFSSLSFSSGAYYKLFDHIFRLSYSGAHRTPHFSELFSSGVHHGTNRYEYGDSSLEKEYANQVDFKYQWSNDHFGVILNPFVQYISDFISIVPVDSNIGGYKVYNYVQYDNVEIQGIEMNLHYHPHILHNLHLEQSYSFLNTINKDDKFGLALVPANSIKTKAKYNFNRLNSLKIIDYISLYHVHKFAQNIHAEYETPTSSYDVMNFQVGFKLNNKFHSAITVNNLLNEKYVPHISRVRGVTSEGIPNPGRFFSINLEYEF